MDCRAVYSLRLTASPNAFIAASGERKSCSACAEGNPPRAIAHANVKMRNALFAVRRRIRDIDDMLWSP
jgi:hypothetical protein